MTRIDFNKLVHVTGRKLYTHAYMMLRDREGSEDAVQEVFIKLWKMNTRLEEYESVEALALTMLRNYCIDQIRKQKYIESGEDRAFSQFHDTEPTPVEKLENKETSDLMNRIINDLPEIYREVIQLRDVEEFSYEEIADRTGQNINTLRVNLSRARKIVRDEFKKHFNESGRNKTIA
jgi:RNA polymerase sigma factor (sigma-70 family)